VRIWKNFCSGRCEFYNMNPYFYEEDGNYAEIYYRYFINKDVHFNKQGHTLIARNFVNLYKNYKQVGNE